MMIKEFSFDKLDVVKNIVDKSIDHTLYDSSVKQKWKNIYSNNRLLSLSRQWNLFLFDEIAVGGYAQNEIHALFTLPGYQQIGVGGKLLSFLEKQISSDFDTCSVVSSVDAVSFYTKKGYEVHSSTINIIGMRVFNFSKLLG